MKLTKTIYRKCTCGETAFDMVAIKVDGGWSYEWRCRNCSAAAKNRNGCTKTYIKLENGQEYSN